MRMSQSSMAFGFALLTMMLSWTNSLAERRSKDAELQRLMKDEALNRASEAESNVEEQTSKARVQSAGKLRQAVLNILQRSKEAPAEDGKKKKGKKGKPKTEAPPAEAAPVEATPPEAPAAPAAPEEAAAPEAPAPEAAPAEPAAPEAPAAEAAPAEPAAAAEAAKPAFDIQQMKKMIGAVEKGFEEQGGSLKVEALQEIIGKYMNKLEPWQLKKMNKNADDVISKAEFEVYVDELLKVFFMQGDANGDGVLTKKETRDDLRGFGVGITDEEFKAIAGNDDKVSIVEFKKWLLGDKAAAATSEPVAAAEAAEEEEAEASEEAEEMAASESDKELLEEEKAEQAAEENAAAGAGTEQAAASPEPCTREGCTHAAGEPHTHDDEEGEEGEKGEEGEEELTDAEVVEATEPLTRKRPKRS
eukprot:TRINITY_DN1733_c0_g2_i2.p1 TRINITY_DN1733_c0_g2~~TRINITY_DN1733_c0_g2_i2.p1  ORF type:complete len:417 (+),score=161.42 TRINITY_DN1733_c0_g2_i2:93-1343(+)